MKKDAYRRIATWYDRLFQPINAGLLALGFRMVVPTEGMRVLDVGCGTGVQLNRYVDAGCVVAGIDPSPSMLAVARERLGETTDLRLGSATDMPFADGEFDLVTSTLVLHELTPQIRDIVLEEMKRVIRPHGHVLLMDYHPGTRPSLRGWGNKLFIILSEIAAGREHFRNYRQFMQAKGLPTLVEQHKLDVVAERVVAKGNLMVMLICNADARADSTEHTAKDVP